MAYSSYTVDTTAPNLIQDWSNPTYEWVEANIDIANCCVTLDDSIVSEIETSGFKNYFDFDSREQKDDGIYATGADKGGYSECVGLPAPKAINAIIYSTTPKTTSKYFILPEESTKTSFIKTVKEKFPNPADNVDKYAEMLGKEMVDTISTNDLIPWLFHEWCLYNYYTKSARSPAKAPASLRGPYVPELFGDGSQIVEYVSGVDANGNKQYSKSRTSYNPLATGLDVVYNNPKQLFYYFDAIKTSAKLGNDFILQISASLDEYGDAGYKVASAFTRIKKSIPYYMDNLKPKIQLAQYFKFTRESNAFNMYIDDRTWDSWCGNVLNFVSHTIQSSILESVANQYTPICIDSRVGNYVTFDTVCSIIEKAFDYFKNNFPMDLMIEWGFAFNFAEAALGKNTKLTSWNIYKYAQAFANMRRSLFEKFTTFEKVNHAAILNFIADNLLVVHKEEIEEVVEDTTPSIELTGNEALDTRNLRLAERQKLSKEYNTSDKDLRIDMRNKASGDSNSNCVYYLSDYNWSMNEKSLNKMGLKTDDFPYIRVYELQPNRQVSFKKIADDLIGGVSGAIGKVAAGFLGTAGTIVTAVANALGSSTSEAQEYSSNTQWVDDLLAGDWVGQYDIPYFGADFFKSSGSVGWSMGNLLEKSDFLQNSLTMNVQDIPTWKYTPGEGQTLTCPIVLVNETIEDFIKNLKFLYSFTMGSFWLQESFLRYRSPNLYRLICPGRFVYLYAAMDVSAEYLGKIKRYSTTDAKRFFGEDDSSFENFKPLKRYITGMDTCNIPEAFRISATFKNLTPNAFNIIDGYMTVSDSAQNIIPNITTAAQGSSYFEIADGAVDSAKSTWGKIKGLASDTSKLTDPNALIGTLFGKSAEEIEALKQNDPQIAQMVETQKSQENAAALLEPSEQGG